MVDLESVLKEVRTLKRDLGYEEWNNYSEPPFWFYWHFFISRHIISKHIVKEPDPEKREEAKIKLLQIYNNSKWYSARYAAARALEVDKTKLNAEVGSWIRELDKLLIPPYSPEEEIYERDLQGLERIYDLEWMYNNLPDNGQRAMAGKALGYSNLGIWLHNLFK